MNQETHIIYIIGFMGSGKTTAGKKLAALLNWSFVDLDKKIEEYTGKTIADIFSQNGEVYFREVESHVLRNLKSNSNTVISTGGGTPCYSDNMDFMLSTGLTIYLKLTTVQLKNRLMNSKHSRPLIKELDQDGLQVFIEEKLAYREKWYSLSDATFEGIDTDIKKMFSFVRSKLDI